MRFELTKHRLMLSAATAALLAVPLFSAAGAATEVSGSKDSAQDTTTDGDITIDAAGVISIKAAKPAVTINSNNFVDNIGVISNSSTTNAIGLEVDTTSTTTPVTPILSPLGFTNAGTMDLSGSGTAKTAILVTGGGSFVGPIDLLPTSSIDVVGDTSSILRLDSGTTMNGNITLSGAMSETPSDVNSTSSASGTAIDIEGNLNGNLSLDSAALLTNVGQGARGITILGNIGPCDTSTGAVCATPAEPGFFANNGSISVTGAQTISSSLHDAESGTAVAIGGNIAGGIINAGPTGSGSTIATASISGNGISPVFVISPSVQAVTTNTPITIGVFAGDTVDPGYSFYNRGNITASATDPNNSTSAVLVGGTSAASPLTMQGGIFDSGEITASAITNQVFPSTATAIQATALSIGSFSTIPKLTVSGEAVGSTSTTQGLIAASVSGIGGGQATAIVIAPASSLPEIDVLAGGKIEASSTSPLAIPTTPTALSAVGIVDESGSVMTINNAGAITAAVTGLTPSPKVPVLLLAQAINLQAATNDGIVINNSGTITGDILMGTAGNGDTLNVGDIGGAGGNGANPATGVVNTTANLATVAGTVDFGSGGTLADPQLLHIGAWGSVVGAITSTNGLLNVQVDNNGVLNVQNTTAPVGIIAATGSLVANKFDINGGALDLTLSEATGNSQPIVQATNEITITPTSKLGLTFGSFISGADPLHPTPQQIVLLSSPTLNLDQTTVNNFDVPLNENLPFLFQANPTPLTLGTSGSNKTLVLTLTPKSPGATNADGSPGLGLTGDALQVYPKAVQAILLDPQLGSALATGITNTQTAQSSFSQFTPDVSGGSRAVAIMITDQSTGPVAARQRLLRDYANQDGELTLWTQEYAGSINNKGEQDANGDITAYKDHGFGFALGMDSGSAQDGWYGGALSFYSGDITETAPRDSKTEAEWYMLTGYTDWRGSHLFLDTQATLGYGSLLGKRDLVTPTLIREADGKRSGLLGALGATTGAIFQYGSFSVTPHFSLDALTMREEGYTEDNGGAGLDLTVAPYYANSLRAFFGTDVAENINLGDFSLKPEARLGYRYDFLADPVKLKAGFAAVGANTNTDPLGSTNVFTLTGPDPEKGDIVGGLSLNALAESWSLGLNYDWIRGSHGSTSQVATFSLLGRI
jgi:hypothetical protein